MGFTNLIFIFVFSISVCSALATNTCESFFSARSEISAQTDQSINDFFMNPPLLDHQKYWSIEDREKYGNKENPYYRFYDYYVDALQTFDYKKVQSTTLTMDESLMIYLYSGNLFTVMNPILYKGTIEDQNLLKPLNDTLSRALRKLPNYRGTVYRMENRNVESFKIGTKLNYKNFLSTSVIDSLTSISGWNVLYKIYSKTGKDISSYSTAQVEKEVLFDKGTSFIIRKIVLQEGNTKKPHLVELEEL